MIKSLKLPDFFASKKVKALFAVIALEAILYYIPSMPVELMEKVFWFGISYLGGQSVVDLGKAIKGIN